MSLKESLKMGVSLRLVIIGVLLLVFMIPTGMVSSLVHERERSSHGVIDEITSKWGRAQHIMGPVLMVPYTQYEKTYMTDNTGKKSERTMKVQKYAYFLPYTLKINADVQAHKRHRNIYEAIVYQSDVKVKGTFHLEDFEKWGIKKKNILFDEARFLFSVSDARGIKEQVVLDFNGKNTSFEAGTLKELSHLFKGGIQARVNAKSLNAFAFHVKLNGSSSLRFSPFGKTTDVRIQSSWKDPSFIGAFLPDSEHITDKGFWASWHVLDLNRGYPQSFLGNEIQMLGASMPVAPVYGKYQARAMYKGVPSSSTHSAFGVEFHKMVDYYQKSERSVKYAMLFLTLTFLLFFFVEVFNKRKIHPFAYILVGLALVLFFVLLLSFSEYIGFNFAYILASVATISSISLYTKSIFQNKKFARIMFALLVLLYAFMFILLQLDGYALLIGSVMLFAVLSVVMYISRDIDWYAMEKE